MTYQSNGTAIGVGVAIFVVVVIIIIVVAFGCNGGWFNSRRAPQAYVALAQQKKKTTTKSSEHHPQEVVLAQKPELDGAPMGCPAGSPAENSTQTSFDNELYDHQTPVDDDNKRAEFNPQMYFPKGEKPLETLADGEDAEDTSALDKNKISVSELKHRYALQGQIGRFMVNSRNGHNRIMGTGDTLLRPWSQDFAKAQQRACERRERRQAQHCDDDSCVQFNESSFMYDACDVV